MARISNHFIIPVYKLIFEHDPPYMYKEVMGEILNISYWYASLGGTLIWMFGGEKPLHVLPRFSTDKLVMQVVPYHMSTGLSTRLHRRKKVPFPALPLWI